MIKKLAASGPVGIALGVVASRYLLVGSWLSLVPWGMVGLLFGWWCHGYRDGIRVGAVYGFLLAFSFMIAGYQGAATLLSRLPFFAALGLFGALCGVALGVVGAFARRELHRI